jgi:tRNA threonylcarbamoyladenosine biosynthesis protein TsaE
MQFEIDTPEHMAELGARLALELRPGDLVALNGELGAGKTTFTRGLGDQLGVHGSVTSPTFVLARTHRRIGGGAPLVHVDAYRLGSAAELDDLDIDWAASIVVVEWASGMLVGVAEHWLEIEIRRPTGAGADIAEGEEPVEPRLVTVTAHGVRWRDLRLV